MTLDEALAILADPNTPDPGPALSVIMGTAVNALNRIAESLNMLAHAPVTGNPPKS